MSEPLIPPAQDENQIMQERRQKLAELREQRLAFPNDFKRRDHAADLHARYGEKTKEELEAGPPAAVALAGRGPGGPGETRCPRLSLREQA